MKKRCLIILVTMLFATVYGCSQEKSDKTSVDKKPEKTGTTSKKKNNGVFELLSFNNDSVRFMVLKETKFYELSLMSGSKAFACESFANSVGDVVWSNGSRFRAGSSLGMPSTFGVGAMTLPQGAVMTVYDFNLPAGFKATKIKFVTEGTTEMYYDILKSSWDN